MERSLGSSGLKIPASSISFANTFGVLVSVALYDLAAVPAARRLGRPISEMGRIGAGYVVLFAALMSGGRGGSVVDVGGRAARVCQRARRGVGASRPRGTSRGGFLRVPAPRARRRRRLIKRACRAPLPLRSRLH